jgi:hypothetical protein
MVGLLRARRRGRFPLRLNVGGDAATPCGLIRRPQEPYLPGDDWADNRRAADGFTDACSADRAPLDKYDLFPREVPSRCDPNSAVPHLR